MVPSKRGWSAAGIEHYIMEIEVFGHASGDVEDLVILP
jgi:hypothetical protein